MYVKYIMENKDDIRGLIKLIVRNIQLQDIAYTVVHAPDDDMVELIPEEIELVKDRTDGLWLTTEKELCRRIDALADAIRMSYKTAGFESIDLEYQQVETAMNEWIAAGSILDECPSEIQYWADLNEQTLDWAIDDINRAMREIRQIILVVRNIRLQAKRDIQRANPEDRIGVYDIYVDQLEAYRQTNERAYG